jgi:hypothetical protein
MAITVERAQTPVVITMPEAAARRLTALLSIVQDEALKDLIEGLEIAVSGGCDVAFDTYYRALDDSSEEMSYPEIEAR